MLEEGPPIPESIVLPVLPSEVLCEIFEKLDLKNRLNLRKVSKTFCQLIDQLKLHLDILSISVRSDCVRYRFNESFSFNKDALVSYNNNASKECILEYDCSKKIAIQENFMKIAVNDLSSVLKPSKIQISSLYVNFHVSHKNPAELLEIFRQKSGQKTRRLQLRQAYLTVNSADQAISIISGLESKTLKTIAINVPSLESTEGIWQLEQFKQAKSAEISAIVEASSLENFYNLTSCMINAVKSIEAQHIVQLRDAFMESATFKYCNIRVTDSLNIDEIGKIAKMRVVDQKISEVYPIANAPNSLRLRITSSQIEFLRM
ncbi:Protein CBG26930 [Caenorhabditis briggsae]|uniref:F-box domain-containing protein n=2 Tax=Caenorhabditis briggsae TaxID=6238 RepID=A0AAE9CYR0_CAEBR|nr:Protein CBG26930 [Caenorhabditis briggsae]ULT86512.1 hypothetical protein L3Y34_006306 [Caenorhabditis briggsae]CAR99261.1 Protein CBG26930 [Caenorhabditis briggsae]